VISRTNTRTSVGSILGGAQNLASFSVCEDCDLDVGIC